MVPPARGGFAPKGGWGVVVLVASVRPGARAFAPRCARFYVFFAFFRPSRAIKDPGRRLGWPPTFNSASGGRPVPEAF